MGPLGAVDPLAASSVGLATHFYELPAAFDRGGVRVDIAFEDGRRESAELELALG